MKYKVLLAISLTAVFCQNSVEAKVCPSFREVSKISNVNLLLDYKDPIPGWELTLYNGYTQTDQNFPLTMGKPVEAQPTACKKAYTTTVMPNDTFPNDCTYDVLCITPNLPVPQEIGRFTLIESTAAKAPTKK